MQKSNSEGSKSPSVDEASRQEVLGGFNYEALELSVPEMLKRGVHFGHKKSRWNPKMKPYTFIVRNNIHIIDLEKTAVLFEKALDYIEGIAASGGKILFIGTKPQTRKLIEVVAHECEMPYVTHRWLGGTFTNYDVIKKRIKYLNDQELGKSRGDFEKFTKYEKSQLNKEIDKMNEKMGGIKTMDRMPQAVFVTDIKEDILALKESRKVKIPTIGIADTNTDPTLVDYPIPGNDDALSSLKYLLGLVVKRIKLAKKKAADEKKADAKNNSQQ
ncbi:MAG: 30S ribosomal protein S2 [Parcubacteria group bacterium]|jgi:small subunit ribosomal protein S2